MPRGSRALVDGGGGLCVTPPGRRARLPVASPTPAASPAPGKSTLVVTLDIRCITNCNSEDGTYDIHVDVLASGGAQPYTYDPAQSYDVTDLEQCLPGEGSVGVTSPDGQTAEATWTYDDIACP